MRRRPSIHARCTLYTRIHHIHTASHRFNLCSHHCRGMSVPDYRHARHTQRHTRHAHEISPQRERPIIKPGIRRSALRRPSRRHVVVIRPWTTTGLILCFGYIFSLPTARGRSHTHTPHTRSGIWPPSPRRRFRSADTPHKVYKRDKR